VFFFCEGARNSSHVGAACCLGFEVFEICLVVIERLKKGVAGFRRVGFAQDEHTQAASLRPKPNNIRGNWFIVFGCWWMELSSISIDVQIRNNSAKP
jgi:hypothetical protein